MTLDDAKAQAKALRAALLAQGTAISHAQALELIARQFGARDWNTLHARLAQRNAPAELFLATGCAAALIATPQMGNPS